MSLIIRQSDDFWADMERQVDWYRDCPGVPQFESQRYSTLQPIVASLRATLTGTFLPGYLALH